MPVCMASDTLIRFELPSEAIDAAGNESDIASGFDCQRPRPSFIVYNNNGFFRDSSFDLNRTNQDVSPYVVAAKVGRATNVRLLTSRAEYTLARPVRCSKMTSIV